MRSRVYKLVAPRRGDMVVQCYTDIKDSILNYRFKAVIARLDGGRMDESSLILYGTQKDVLNASEWRTIPDEIHEEFREKEKPTATTKCQDWYKIPISELPLSKTKQTVLDTLLEGARSNLTRLVEEAVEEVFDFSDKKGRKRFGVVMSYFPQNYRQAIEPQDGSGVAVHHSTIKIVEK